MNANQTGNVTTTRRWFLGSVAHAALLVSISTAARAAGRIPRVALVANFVVADGKGADPVDPFVRAFIHGLRDLGLVDGRNLVVFRRSTEGRIGRLPGLMQELVGLGVDVIVAVGGPAVWAAHRATERALDRIAIVGVVDEVLDTGLVDSLGRPGRNLTGIGQSDASLHGKRLELLKETTPTVSRVAVLCYRQGPNDRGGWRREFDTSAHALKLDVQWLGVDAPEDFEPAFAALVRERGGAIYATATHVNDAHAKRIADFALRQRLPSIGFPEHGMLFGYDADETELLRRTAAFVKKILEGAKPGELPFEQPTKYELVINLKTARALGIAMPQLMLLRASQVIE